MQSLQINQWNAVEIFFLAVAFVLFNIIALSNGWQIGCILFLIQVGHFTFILFRSEPTNKKVVAFVQIVRIFFFN